MSLLNRWKSGQPAVPSPAAGARARVETVSSAAAEAAAAGKQTRTCNSLKDFLWHLSGIGRGNLLDLGPAWQSSIQFFGDRGFKVFSEDLLTGWKFFLREQEGRDLALSPTDERPSKDAVARKFLESNLQYKPNSFDAVVLWDLFDYMDPDASKRSAERIADLLREGGVILALFHTKHPDRFRRYRVLDEATLEVLATQPLVPFVRVFQNREMMDLFSGFHSSKTYLGRDQIREALFVK